MTQFVALLATLSLAVVATVAQDAAFQQGLSLHNQQIQEHLRKEAEQQRAAGQLGASHAPQNHYQQQQPQYYQQQQAAPQQQYQGGEDDGQYRPELYNNPNNFARSNPEQVYQAGLKSHQAQIQEHLQKEGRFQSQANQIGDPIYQQGLQVHQRAIQDHLQKEQQLGGPAPQAYHQPQQRAYQPQAAPQYQNAGQGSAQEFEQGIQLHMQQLLQHQRQEQQQQAQVGQASQYHQSQQPRSY